MTLSPLFPLQSVICQWRPPSEYLSSSSRVFLHQISKTSSWCTWLFLQTHTFLCGLASTLLFACGQKTRVLCLVLFMCDVCFCDFVSWGAVDKWRRNQNSASFNRSPAAADERRQVTFSPVLLTFYSCVIFRRDSTLLSVHTCDSRRCCVITVAVVEPATCRFLLSFRLLIGRRLAWLLYRICCHLTGCMWTKIF